MASHCGFQGISSLAPPFLDRPLSSGSRSWTMRGFLHLSPLPVTASLRRTSLLGYGRPTTFSFATTPTGDRYSRPTRARSGFWRRGKNILLWTWAAKRSDSPLTASSQLTWTWPGLLIWPSPDKAADLQLCPCSPPSRNSHAPRPSSVSWRDTCRSCGSSTSCTTQPSWPVNTPASAVTVLFLFSSVGEFLGDV